MVADEQRPARHPCAPAAIQVRPAAVLVPEPEIDPGSLEGGRAVRRPPSPVLSVYSFTVTFPAVRTPTAANPLSV